MTLASLLLGLLSAGCRAPESAEVRFQASPGTSAADDDFPGAARFGLGFDPFAKGPAFRAGDEVLFGLCLRRADTTRRWLLHLRVTEPDALARAGDAVAVGMPLPPVEWTMRINGAPTTFPSRLCRVLTTVCDADGTVLGRTEPLLPWQLLASGFQPACERVARLRRGHRPSDQRALAEAIVCAVALLQIVQEDNVLAPLLWEVVERPSLWSVVRSLGARILLRAGFDAAVEVEPRVPVRSRTWQVPIRLLVNDRDALLLDVFAASPARPFALCGGIVGATARHPTDASVEFSLRLLSAHVAR